MSSIYTVSQTATAIPGASFPSRDALVQSDLAVRSRSTRQSQLYLAFHYILLLYLFAYVSRISDFLPWFRAGMLLLPVMLVGLFLTKNTGVLWQVRSTRWLVAFTAWVAVCVPFSFWMGGSFWVFVKALQALLLVAFMMAFLRTVQDVMRALSVVAVASGLVAIGSFVSSGGIGTDRQGLTGSGALSDANFFALYLAVCLALLCLVVSLNRGWLRFVSLAVIPVSLVAIARSGSRAGLITLGVGLIMLLIHGSTTQRTIVLSAGLLGVLLGAAFLPQNIVHRFSSWVTPSGFASAFSASGRSMLGPMPEDYDMNRGVDTPAGSAEARIYLFKRSLVLTAKNPLFGVGPDQFINAEAADAATRGVRGTWHYTHNTYTEFSSEVGIPGFVLFAGAFFGGYRGLSTIRKRGPTRRIRQMALFLQTAYLMLMVGAFFLTLSYGGLPYIFIGFSVAFQLAVRRYIRETGVQSLRQEVSVAV